MGLLEGWLMGRDRVTEILAKIIHRSRLGLSSSQINTHAMRLLTAGRNIKNEGSELDRELYIGIESYFTWLVQAVSVSSSNMMMDTLSC